MTELPRILAWATCVLVFLILEGVVLVCFGDFSTAKAVRSSIMTLFGLAPIFAILGMSAAEHSLRWYDRVLSPKEEED